MNLTCQKIAPYGAREPVRGRSSTKIAYVIFLLKNFLLTAPGSILTTSICDFHYFININVKKRKKMLHFHDFENTCTASY